MRRSFVAAHPWHVSCAGSAPCLATSLRAPYTVRTCDPCLRRAHALIHSSVPSSSVASAHCARAPGSNEGACPIRARGRSPARSPGVAACDVHTMDIAGGRVRRRAAWPDRDALRQLLGEGGRAPHPAPGLVHHAAESPNLTCALQLHNGNGAVVRTRAPCLSPPTLANLQPRKRGIAAGGR